MKVQLEPAAASWVVLPTTQGEAPVPGATTKSEFELVSVNAEVTGPNTWNVCAAVEVFVGDVTGVGAVAEKLKNDGVM